MALLIYCCSGHTVVSANGELIAACGIAHGIHIYSLPSFAHLQTIHHPYVREGVSVNIAFAQLDSLLVVGSDHGRVCIYDVCTGAFIMGLPHTSPGRYLFN
jgi:hypothetical protein